METTVTPKSSTGNIVFFCKDCEEIVDTIRIGGKYVYKCKKCGTKNVAFGTVKSINNFFRLEAKEKEKKKELARQARKIDAKPEEMAED